MIVALLSRASRGPRKLWLLYMLGLNLSPNLASADLKCPPHLAVRADLEAWKAELTRKAPPSQARIEEMLKTLHLKTGTARELPDIERGQEGQRQLTIDGVDIFKAKLRGDPLPERIVQLRYRLKIGKSCGEHEDHCFEGYAIQVLSPLAKNQWCSWGTDLSAEIWGPDRDFEFCPDAKSPARELAFFALSQPGYKAIQVDDYRAHCPSTSTLSSSHERSYWEIQKGFLTQIFKITLHSQSGGPNFGKLTTLKGKLTFAGEFPRRIHYEAVEEDCTAGVFSEDPKRAKKACKKSNRFQAYVYKEGRYEAEAPPPAPED